MDDATQVGNIIGSICVPFTIVPMLKFCNSTRLMGVSHPPFLPHLTPPQEHTIDWMTSTVISILAILLILLNCGLFYEYFLKIP
jgi:Mn2+/Fe2+ NRAMP family transporter